MRIENKLRGQSIFSMKHIWKVLLLIAFIGSSSQLSAQILPIGSGLKDTVSCIYTTENAIYAVTRNVFKMDLEKPEIDSVKLLKWNGMQWSIITQFVVVHKDWIDWSIDKNSWTREIAIYKDQIYFNGRYDSIVGLDGRKFRFLKWNGKNLEPITTLTPSYYQYTGLNNLTVFDDKLYVVSDSGKLFSYNDTLWENVSNTFNSNDSLLRYIFNKAIYNGKLYMTGRVHKKGGADSTAPYLKLLSWDGNIWRIERDSLSEELVSKNDKGILIAEVKGAGFFNGQKISYLNYENFFYNPIVSFSYGYKDKLFLKVESNIDSLYMFWDGFNWISVFYNGYKLPKKFKQNITFFDFKNELHAFGSFKDKYNNFFTVGKVIEPSQVKGSLYWDKSLNCKKDLSEQGIEQGFLMIDSKNIINTDSNGNYLFYADTGVHNLQIITPRYWKSDCQNNGNISIHVVLDSINENNDFALTPKYNAQDIRVTLSGSLGWRARQGFTENYTLCYENVGTTKASGKIALKLDSNFTNFSSMPSPKSYTYPFAEWEFDSLEIGGKRCITFKARLDSATLNDSVTLIAAFDGGDNWIDSSMNDNSDTLKQRVVAALDPNDKTSFPEGNITKETKELRYQIRFQNVGTDTAYRVTVIDTIDTNLPLTKVMMNSASHKYKLDIKNNVFKWTFDGIMLPDDKTNEPLSNGFINYTAQIKQGLAIGTEIKNTAYIYFDYQKPVITNTARSKMTEPVGIRKENAILGNSLNIYPNPASSKVYLKNTSNTRKQVVVFNSIGQQIQTLILQPQDATEWNINHLSNGLYFIQADGEQTHKLLIQH
ncbi:MAG: DUF7619 domain-containing protein [Bacteroidia bacterium]